MSVPKRIQRRRTKGWKMPEGAVYVGRPSKWGNPWPVKQFGRKYAVKYFEAFMKRQGILWTQEALNINTGDLGGLNLSELRGKDLACWCHLCDAHKDGKSLGVECPDCDPCHVDVLLSLANQED